MAKRRPSGDGMVRKKEDGRWEGRIVVGHKDNGDSIFRYIYAVPGKPQQFSYSKRSCKGKVHTQFQALIFTHIQSICKGLCIPYYPFL